MKNGLIGLLAFAVLPAIVSLGAAQTYTLMGPTSNLIAATQYQIKALPLPPATMGDYTFAGTSAEAVNASGQIAFDVYYQGMASPENPVGPVITLAMLYQSGHYSSLPIPPSLGTSAQSIAMNIGGSVAGSVWGAAQAGVQYPMVWKGGVAISLPMGGFSSGIAYTINDMGEAGGMLTAGNNTDSGHAVWWESNGVMHDLGTFGGVSADVHAINNNGQMLVDVDFGDHSGALLLDHGNTADCQRTGVNATYAGFAVFANKKDIQDGVFSVTLRALAGGSGFSIVFDPVKGAAWESAEDIVKPESLLMKKLKAEDPKKTVVMFSVWGDSFDLYVKVVSIAKTMGFRTAWIPYGNDEEMKETIRPGSPTGPDNGVEVEK